MPPIEEITCLNTIVADYDVSPKFTASGVRRFKGTYMFTYLRDVAGGNSEMKGVLDLNGRDVYGRPTKGPIESNVLRKKLRAEQKLWFGSDNHVVDLNVILNKNQLTSVEVYKFLYTHGEISMESITDRG